MAIFLNNAIRELIGGKFVNEDYLLVRKRKLERNYVGSRWGGSSWPVEEWVPCTELSVGGLGALFEEDFRTLPKWKLKKILERVKIEVSIRTGPEARETDKLTATRLPKWLFMRFIVNLIPYSVTINSSFFCCFFPRERMKRGRREGKRRKFSQRFMWTKALRV